MLFVIWPVIFSTAMSLTNWTGFSFNNVKFVGIDNFKWLLTEADFFWSSLSVSLKFAFLSTTLQTILGYFLGFILYNMTKRMQGLYKVLLYLPVILPAAVVSVMWSFIYTPDYGLLNQLLRSIGLEGLTRMWLVEQGTALGAVIFTNTWRYVGFTTILYFVAMNAVSKEVIESARIDGANNFKLLSKMFLPMTWETTQINIILSLVGGIKSFDLFFLLTGGAAGTKVVGITIYNTGFGSFKFSKAIAMSMIIFLVALIMTVLVRKIQKKDSE